MELVFFEKYPRSLLTINTMCDIVLCEKRYYMDIQLKRGLLELCVLAAIKDKDSYGYQMIKDMKPYVMMSESTLYPILRRLEESDLLTVRTEEHQGRLRKYYGITPSGRAKLAAFPEEWKELEAIHQFIVKEDGPDDEN